MNEHDRRTAARVDHAQTRAVHDPVLRPERRPCRIASLSGDLRRAARGANGEEQTHERVPRAHLLSSARRASVTISG